MDCPLCNGPMELRQVAPCFDYGHEPEELDELSRGEHEDFVYEVFGQQTLLCDFCDADFGSYYPEYFGLPAGPCQRYPLERVSTLANPHVDTDASCAECQHRLDFLIFLSKARAYNSA